MRKKGTTKIKNFMEGKGRKGRTSKRQENSCLYWTSKDYKNFVDSLLIELIFTFVIECVAVDFFAAFGFVDCNYTVDAVCVAFCNIVGSAEHINTC